MINYTKINHDARKRLGLNCNDYCLLDIVFNLSKKAPCYAERQTLAGYLDISRQALNKIIKRLKAKNYLQTNNDTKLLKVTLEWERETNPEDTWFNRTTVNHEARKRLDLSINEYCLLDKVYRLSLQSESKFWCYETKPNLAQAIGVTEPTVFTLINILIERKYLLRDSLSKRLKVRIDWFNEVNIQNTKESLHDTKESLHQTKESLHDTKESLHQYTKESLHDNPANRGTFEPNNATFSGSYKEKINKENNKENTKRKQGEDNYSPNRAVPASANASSNPNGQAPSPLDEKQIDVTIGNTPPNGQEHKKDFSHYISLMRKINPALELRESVTISGGWEYKTKFEGWKLIDNIQKFYNGMAKNANSGLSHYSKKTLKKLQEDNDIEKLEKKKTDEEIEFEYAVSKND